MDKNLTKINLEKLINVPILEEVVNEKNKEENKVLNIIYATGRRKNAVAKVWLSIGKEFLVNKMLMESYFLQEPVINNILFPLKIVKMQNYKINSFVSGGGKVSQALALRLAISKALVIFDPTFKVELREYKLLTSDSRKKEREHIGFRTSRKSQQYSRR